jgi:hypothetical protein
LSKRNDVLTFQIAIRGSVAAAVAPLPVTFDHALAALERLNRLFIEPDGSFVWTGALPDGTPWQVDGNLIDQGERLAYVDLKGCCPEAQFNQLVATLGWPQVPLAFELTRRGIVVDEAEFRRLATTQAGAV